MSAKATKCYTAGNASVKKTQTTQNFTSTEQKNSKFFIYKLQAGNLKINYGVSYGVSYAVSYDCKLRHNAEHTPECIHFTVFFLLLKKIITTKTIRKMVACRQLQVEESAGWFDEHVLLCNPEMV